MATLVEVSKQLSQQGSILQDTNQSIEEMLRVVKNQLNFFTRKEAGDRLQNLEDERERQRDSRPQSSVVEKLSAGNLDKVPTNFKDFLKFFGAGFGGVLAYLTERTFKVLRKLLRGGFVLLVFPFVKKLADKIGEQFTKLIDIAFEEFLDFELTDEQKKKITSALGEGIKTGIIAKLFGFGIKTSLIAGVIGFAFDAISAIFPDFGEYVEGTGKKVIAWLKANGMGKVAELLENNPEAVKTALAIGGAVVATRLLPAVFALGGSIIASAFGFMATQFAAATVALTAGGLFLKIAGASVLVLGAAALSYIFLDEIREAVQKSMDALDDAMRSFTKKIFDYGGGLITGAIDRLRYFILGIDPTQFSQETLDQKTNLKAAIEELEQQKKDAIAAAVNADPTLENRNPYNLSDYEFNKIEEIKAPIIEAYDLEINKLKEQLKNVNNQLDIEGGKPGYVTPGNIVVNKEAFEKILRTLRENPNTKLPNVSADELQEFLRENENYVIPPPNISNVSGNDQSSNTQINNNSYSGFSHPFVRDMFNIMTGFRHNHLLGSRVYTAN